MRLQEKEENREWERRYFTRVEVDPVFAALASKRGITSEAEKTNGVWVFDEAKFTKVLARQATPSVPTVSGDVDVPVTAEVVQ